MAKLDSEEIIQLNEHASVNSLVGLVATSCFVLVASEIEY